MTQHTLILMRHAKSDWDGEEADLERPLAARGRREAPAAGDWLAAHAPALSQAVVSPAVRAQQTWALVSSRLHADVPTRTDPRVYDASVEDLLNVVQALPEDAAVALVVGHNPGLEALVRRLTGEVVPMPTCALAVLALAGPWSAVTPAAARLLAAGRPPKAR